MKSKASKNLFTSIVIFLAAILVLTTVVVAQIYAWFVQNEEIVGDLDSNVVTYQEFELKFSYDGSTWVGTENSITLDDFYPGDINKKTIYFSAKNIGTKNLSTNLFFYPPYGEFGKEIPHIVLGNHHYLGSQIQVSDIRIKELGVYVPASSFNVGKGEYLVPTSSFDLDKGQVVSVPSAVSNVPRLTLVQDYTLVADREVIFEFDFTFVDNGQNQNIYQNNANFSTERKFALEWS